MNGGGGMEEEPVDLWGTDLHYVLRGGVRLLDGVDLTVPAGAITGILGPNGSGKTTLLRVIIGALEASGGDVVVGDLSREAGTSLPAMPRLERARRLAMVEQDSRPHDDLTVAEVVALGRLPHQGRFGGAGDAAARDSARRAGVDHLWERSFTSLSGGERQRVHLARALAQTPRVLLLDEPTNHLDLAAQVELLDLAAAVAGAGAGVLLTLHDLSLAARVCDQVLVLSEGAVLAAGPPLQVLTAELIGQVWGVGAQWVHSSYGPTLVVGPR